MINTREIAQEYRLSHWTQIMQERVQSGLSIKDFCKQIGICGNTYFYWQRRLRAAACEGLMTHVQTEAVEPADAAIPTGWAACEVSSKSPIEDKVLHIEINGCHVLAKTDTAPELLAKVCKVLMSLC